jgi:hypothetical protein
MHGSRDLRALESGSKLPLMVGAVIYVRVSNEGADREPQPADTTSRVRGVLSQGGL